MEEKKRKVKDESYFQISGWMVNPQKMNLKGLKLQLFAIIFGMSQDGEFCHPSIRYFAEFTGSTERGVRKALDEMVEEGTILRRKSAEFKTNEYAAVVPDWNEQSSPEAKKEELSSEIEELSSKKEELSSAERNSVPPSEELSSANNIVNNIDNNSCDNRQRKKEGSSFLSFSDCPLVQLTMSELLFLNRYYGPEITDKYIHKLQIVLDKPGRHFNSHFDVIEKWIIEDNPTLGSEGT